MAQVTISARIDSDDKIRFDEFCKNVGINASSAINIFVKTVLRKNKIPFELENEDPFYSEANINELKRRIKNAKAGKNMHEHEIIEV